jgi:PAS domain S-box-containing protein
MTTPHLAEQSGRPMSPWPRAADDRLDPGAAAAAMLDALVGQASVGVAFYDSQGRHVRVNEVFAALGGRAGADYAGRTIPEVWGEPGRELERLLGRVLSTGEAITELEVGFPADAPDRPRIWALSWLPVSDPRLGIVGAACVATDVTARRDAALELARADALHRALAGAGALDVLHAGPDGTPDVDLPGWRALTGQSRSDLAGLGWLDAVHTADRDRVVAAWQGAVGSGEPFEAEFRVPAADGADHIVAARLLPVAADGRITEWIGVSQDVTEARYGDTARVSLAALTARLAAAGEHTERLAGLAASLARAVTIDDVVVAVLDTARRGFGAAGRGIALVDGTRDGLRFRALEGCSDGIAARWNEIGLGAVHPVAETVRGGRALFLSEREELMERWPVAELAADVSAAAERSWAMLPLTTTQLPFGVLMLGFTEPRTFTEQERADLVALAGNCARALERATVFEQVQEQATAGRDAVEGARSAESAARAAEHRLDVLARVRRAVAAAGDPAAALRAFGAAVVGELADVCAVYALEPDAEPDADAGTDVDADPGAPVDGPRSRRLMAVAAPALGELPLPRARGGRWPAGSPAGVAAAGGQGAVGPADGAQWPADSVTERWSRRAGAHTLAAVPVVRCGEVVGVVTYTAAGERPPFAAADLAYLEEIAGTVAGSIEDIDADGRGRDGALDLQRSLLPADVVGVDGLDLAARYVPGLAGAQGDAVGGDWFDTIDLGSGRVALVVGGVAGRGTRAAVLMGQLRTAARVCARVGMPPREVLAQLTAVMADLADGRSATCVYVVVEPFAGVATLASAGHPPPLFIATDGLVSRPYMKVGEPLGAGRGEVREYTVPLAAGSGIAMFTEGLVRFGDRDVDAGVSALAAVLSAQGGPAAERVADALAELGRADGPDEDVVLLIARLTGDAAAVAGG